MRVSRRKFLNAATASAATLLAFRPTGSDRFGPRDERILRFVILDLKSHCVLRESLEGYRAALADQSSYVTADSVDSRWFCRIAIVPAVGTIDLAIAQMLLDLMNGGTHLLLESGAAFFTAVEFAAHQKMLRRYFDLAIEPPIDLWSGRSGQDALFRTSPGPREKRNVDCGICVPYVTYVWPRETLVRDFSRAVPVSAKDGDVIGRVGSIPIALKKRLANGTLIFLGSQLGPALLAGDPEARYWLRSVTSL